MPSAAASEGHGARGRPRGVGPPGAVAAAYALEHLGGQSHAYTWTEFLERFSAKLWCPRGLE